MGKAFNLLKAMLVAIIITGCVIASVYFAYILVILAVLLPIGFIANWWLTRQSKTNYFDYVDEDD